MSGPVLLLCVTATAGIMYLAFKLFFYLSQRFQNRKWLRLGIRIVAFLGLALTVYVGLAVIFISLTSYYPHRDFNKADWSKNIDQRYTMVDDLSEKMIGWDKEHVTEELGAPEFQESFQNSLSFRYATGDLPQIVGGADPFEIVVEFEKGKVTRCYILET